MTATALTTRDNSGAGFWPSALAVARRTIRTFVRTPQLIVFVSLQILVFLILFRYVFGGAISVDGQRYVDFLIPGFLVTCVVIAGVGASVGIADDVDRGFFDRLRSLPISRTSVLTGRCLADTVLATWCLALGAALGFAFGFRVHGSAADAVAAVGLCVVFGFAFAWLFITLGLVAGNAQAAQGMSMPVWPLLFLSSAYVPVESLPGWLQPFAEHQPVTPMVNAVRGLTAGPQAEVQLGHGTSYYVVLSLIWSAGIVLVFGLLAVVRFSRR